MRMGFMDGQHGFGNAPRFHGMMARQIMLFIAVALPCASMSGWRVRFCDMSELQRRSVIESLHGMPDDADAIVAWVPKGDAARLAMRQNDVFPWFFAYPLIPCVAWVSSRPDDAVPSWQFYLKQDLPNGMLKHPREHYFGDCLLDDNYCRLVFYSEYVGEMQRSSRIVAWAESLGRTVAETNSARKICTAGTFGISGDDARRIVGDGGHMASDPSLTCEMLELDGREMSEVLCQFFSSRNRRDAYDRMRSQSHGVLLDVSCESGFSTEIGNAFRNRCIQSKRESTERCHAGIGTDDATGILAAKAETEKFDLLVEYVDEGAGTQYVFAFAGGRTFCLAVSGGRYATETTLLPMWQRKNMDSLLDSIGGYSYVNMPFFATDTPRQTATVSAPDRGVHGLRFDYPAWAGRPPSFCEIEPASAPDNGQTASVRCISLFQDLFEAACIPFERGQKQWHPLPAGIKQIPLRRAAPGPSAIDIPETEVDPGI